MKIMIEAGHGKHYRQKGEYDFGLFADDGSHESAITRAYSARLKVLLKEHGHTPDNIMEGTIAARFAWAFRRNKRFIISLHMSYDPGALPGGRVAWATDGSKAVAEAVAQALGFPVIQVPQETGLLRFNPSIEIELGNIASWQDMKRLRCASVCSAICNKIIAAVAALFDSPAEAAAVPSSSPSASHRSTAS